MPRTHHLGALALAVLTWLLVTAPAPAQDAALQLKINAAIDKGVAHLKKIQQADGTWGTDFGTGSTLLAAWTLLESGVSRDDPAIVKAAKYIRQELLRESLTYQLALGIIFLDKLGDAQDIPIIEALAIRLLSGQSTYYGWSYNVPPPSDAEANWLTQVLQRRRPPLKKPEGVKPIPVPRTFQHLTPEARSLLVALANRDPNLKDAAAGDNSNTQFAMVALWVARRYGLPVDKALWDTSQRFRQLQDKKMGYWKYTFDTPNQVSGAHAISPAMTCAGLLGLALEHAITSVHSKAPPRPILEDAAVKAGFKVLGNVFDKGYSEITPPGAGNEGNRIYYFLWSLERMAVVYDVKEINGHNWYVWGAQELVRSQGDDGSWSGAYSQGGVDTCFGLLFLKRANVAEDLTDALKGKKPADVVKTNPKDNVNVPLATFIPKIDPKKPDSGRLPGFDDPKPNPKKIEDKKIEDKKKAPRIEDNQSLLPLERRLEFVTSLIRRSETGWVRWRL